MDKQSGHHKHGGSLKWATAKHALRCLIGCNIGEGAGAALGYLYSWDIDYDNNSGCSISIYYRLSIYYDTNAKDNAT